MQKKSGAIQSKNGGVENGANGWTKSDADTAETTTESTTETASRSKKLDEQNVRPSSSRIREFLFNKNVEEAVKTLQTVEKMKTELNRLSKSSCTGCTTKMIEFKNNKLKVFEETLSKYNFRVIREAKRRIQAPSTLVESENF